MMLLMCVACKTTNETEATKRKATTTNNLSRMQENLASSGPSIHLMPALVFPAHKKKKFK